jgi:hypothetical protein
VASDEAAAEFAGLARDRGGRSDEGFSFDRRDAHVENPLAGPGKKM